MRPQRIRVVMRPVGRGSRVRCRMLRSARLNSLIRTYLIASWYPLAANGHLLESTHLGVPLDLNLT